MKVIGNGAFSCVHLAEYNGEKVALKVLTIPPLSDPATFFDDFHQEVSLLDTLVNKNIVVLKGFSFSPLAMLIEYLPLDSLYDWLRKKPVIDWPLRLRIVNDIASAMTYLHTFKPPILHRDLKTPNILLASSNPEADVVAKITDFGTATKLFSSFKGQTAKEREVVNPTWLSPEVILGSNYQIASDVYPIALIMWELLTGSHPFEEFDQKFNSGLEELIIKGARPTIPSSCPEKYKLLIMACWEHNYEKRPTYKMIHETLLPAIVQELCPTFYPKLANLNTDTNQPSVPNDEALFEVDGISYKVADFNEVISRYKDKQLRFREAVLYWKNKSDAIVEREKKLAEREDAVFLLEGKLRSVIHLIEDNHKVDLKSFLALLPSEEEKNQMEKRRETQNEPEERESRRIAYDFDRNRRAFNNANPLPAQPSPRKRGITRSNSSPHTPKKVSANQNQELELTISTNPIKDENDLILLKSQPIAEQSEIRKPDVSGPWSRKSMVHDMNRSTPYMGMNREKTAADSNFWNSMRYQQDPSITSTKANGLTTFQIQSGWTKENSPGALLRYNWWDTSQYIIKVIQEGVITIVLQQENKKPMPKIALHIVKADAVPRRKIKISPEDIVHKSDTYIDKDFVRLDIELTPGFYNLICSTFDPEEENAFRLVCRGAVEIFNVSNFDWLRISLTGYWRNSTPVSEGLQWEDPDSKFILFVREKGIVNICLSCREEGLCGHYGIGFTLWSREKEQIGRSNYTKRCYTVYVSEIDEGEYFIIPSTVSAGMTAPYTLQIFSSHLCHLRILK
uniref:Protein kinase domain-containing protein n=1 Tax=Arcella intermedia TaxID=1963864 RepID=A0A6B2KXU7_9EUKA